MTAKALLNESETEPNEWAERCGYWLKALEVGKPKRKRREKESFPLVLNGNGLSIAVDKGTLIVKGGFTHYPQEKQEQQFFKGELTIPPRIVIVDGSGAAIPRSTTSTAGSSPWPGPAAMPQIGRK